ncbi:unnamed protein product [Sympodiomycopsis kandeliae]
MSSERPIDVQPVTNTEKRVKPSPNKSNATFKTVTYTPSVNKTDSNLLILFHGLGDTSASFSQLGIKQFQSILPQCCILTIQGNTQLPILDTSACSYWNVFDPLCEMLPPAGQNPKEFLEAFSTFIKEEVVGRCGWDPKNIHLFGFAHGATAMIEGVLHTYKGKRIQFGSVVAVCPEILSFPTLDEKISTPLLHFKRNESKQLQSTLARAFKHINTVSHPTSSSQQQPESLPRGKEWDEIFKFWSKTWRNRSEWEWSQDVYQVA